MSASELVKVLGANAFIVAVSSNSSSSANGEKADSTLFLKVPFGCILAKNLPSNSGKLRFLFSNKLHFNGDEADKLASQASAGSKLVASVISYLTKTVSCVL